MLDVHPPHHAAHGWRDFMVHIATIVVGLLIAIGLEQTVEFVHHRHEVRETREALRKEREQNIARFGMNTQYVQSSLAELQNSLLVLRYLKEHPGTPQEKLPGVLTAGIDAEPPADAVWRTAQQTGVTALMPRDEVERYAELYASIAQANAESTALWAASTDALSYFFRQPDLSRLTPDEVDAEIAKITRCMELTYRWGVDLENIHDANSDFVPFPSLNALNVLIGFTPSDADRIRLAAPLKQTDERLKAVRDEEDRYRNEHLKEIP